jgi:hypothetical protein
MADNPEEPGVKCLRIELSLSPAILNMRMRYWENAEERLGTTEKISGGVLEGCGTVGEMPRLRGATPGRDPIEVAD